MEYGWFGALFSVRAQFLQDWVSSFKTENQMNAQSPKNSGQQEIQLHQSQTCKGR